MFIDEVGASDLVNRTDKVRKSHLSRTDNVKSAKADQLDLSKVSGFQLAIRDAIAGSPEIREDKVKEISEKINNGTYSTSSKDVAKKIMESDEHNGTRLELFG